MTRREIGVIATGVLLWVGAVHAETPDPAAETMKKYFEAVRAVRAETGVRRDEIDPRLRDYIDFDRLARLSLRDQWDKITPKQRTEYVRNFSLLVQVQHLTSGKGLMAGSPKVTPPTEYPSKNEAKVNAVIPRHDIEVEASYFLGEKDGKWKIYNWVADSVNVADNYGTQFNALTQRLGFNYVLETLRRRLKEEGIEAK